MSCYFFQPTGPQALLQIKDFCLFDNNVNPKNVTQVVINETSASVENVCDNFSFTKPKQPQLPDRDDDGFHSCKYRPSNLAGVLPTVPFGYVQQAEESNPPWLKFAFSNEEKKQHYE